MESSPRGSSKSLRKVSKRPSTKVAIEVERIGLKGKLLFRAAVKKVITFKEWMREIDNYLSGAIRSSNVLANKKTLPLEAKMILIKDPMSRTLSEQQELEGMLSGLYFYNRYPEKEYKQLIGKTNCTIYKPGKIVYRQSQILTDESRLYYIVDGFLSVEIEIMDMITLETHVEVFKKIGPGDQFGDKAILFNEDREATVATLTDVTLLYINKEDFEAILMESLEKKWGLVRKATNELPYFFEDWTDAELRRCSIISELVPFQEGDLILGDGYGKTKSAHFIMEGECSMIQDIEVEQRGARWKLVNSNDDASPITDDERREHVYLQTNVFSKGACFSVGEKLDNRRYVAESYVKCLLVPQYLLLAHNRFGTYKQFLESRLFTTEQLFSSFLYSRRRFDFHTKNLLGSKAKPEYNESLLEIYYNQNVVKKLEKKVETLSLGKSGLGEGDLPIQKSQSRLMAELSKRISENCDIEFKKEFGGNEANQNLTELTIQHSQEKITTLQENLAKERVKRRQLERTLANGLEFCFRLEQQKQSIRKRLLSSKSVRNKLQTELNNVQNENKVLDELLGKEKTKYASLRNEMIMKKRTNIESQMRIFEMEKEIDGLKSELNSERLELVKAKNVIKLLESNNFQMEKTESVTNDCSCSNSFQTEENEEF